MKLLHKFLSVIRHTEIFPRFPCILLFSESKPLSPVDYTTTLSLAVHDRFYIKHSRLLGLLFQSPSNLVPFSVIWFEKVDMDDVVHSDSFREVEFVGICSNFRFDCKATDIFIRKLSSSFFDSQIPSVNQYLVSSYELPYLIDIISLCPLCFVLTEQVKDFPVNLFHF